MCGRQLLPGGRGYSHLANRSSRSRRQLQGRFLQAGSLQSDMSLTLALKLIAADTLVNSDGQIRNRQLNIFLVHAVFQMPAKKRYFVGRQI